jgi:hypothetical protein
MTEADEDVTGSWPNGPGPCCWPDRCPPPWRRAVSCSAPPRPGHRRPGPDLPRTRPAGPGTGARRPRRTRPGQQVTRDIGSRTGRGSRLVGFARISLGDLDGAAASERAAAEGAADDHLTTSIIMSTTARIAESRGHLGEALELAADAVRRADASPGRLGHGFPVCVTQGRLLIALDRLPEARSADAGVRVSEELRRPRGAGHHRYRRARGRAMDDARPSWRSASSSPRRQTRSTALSTYGLLSRSTYTATTCTGRGKADVMTATGRMGSRPRHELGRVAARPHLRGRPGRAGTEHDGGPAGLVRRLGAG